MNTCGKCLVFAVAIVLVCGASSSVAQPTLEWSRTFGTSNWDESYTAAADGLGNVYIGGMTLGILPGAIGNGSGFLAKYDAGGTLQWVRQTDRYEAVQDVSIDELGHVYAAGGGDPGDLFLAKFDLDGTPLWTQQLDAPMGGGARAVATDGLGNAYVAGHNIVDGHRDAFVSKYDPDGILQWKRMFGSNDRDEALALSTDPIGNVYVGGVTEGSLFGPNAGRSDAFLAKYDANGALQWTRQYGNSENNWISDLSTDPLGQVFAANAYEGQELIKFDSEGMVQWSGHSEIAPNYIEAVSADWHGNVYASIRGESFIAVSKYDGSGALQWTVPVVDTLRDLYFENVGGLAVNPLGDVFVSGHYAYSLELSAIDTYVAKIADRNAIPEPASAWLVTLASLTLLRLRSQVDPLVRFFHLFPWREEISENSIGQI